MMPKQNRSAALGLVDPGQVPVGFGPAVHLHEAGPVACDGRGIVVVMSGVHRKKLPIRVPEAEVTRLLADVIREPEIAGTARKHSVIAPKTEERNVVAEDLAADVEKMRLLLLLGPGVVDIAEMKQDLGLETGDLLQQMDCGEDWRYRVMRNSLRLYALENSKPTGGSLWYGKAR